MIINATRPESSAFAYSSAAFIATDTNKSIERCLFVSIPRRGRFNSACLPRRSRGNRANSTWRETSANTSLALPQRNFLLFFFHAFERSGEKYAKSPRRKPTAFRFFTKIYVHHSNKNCRYHYTSSKKERLLGWPENNCAFLSFNFKYVYLNFQSNNRLLQLLPTSHKLVYPSNVEFWSRRNFKEESVFCISLVSKEFIPQDIVQMLEKNEDLLKKDGESFDPWRVIAATCDRVLSCGSIIAPYVS